MKLKTEFNRKDYEFARQAPKGGYWEHEEQDGIFDDGGNIAILFVAVALVACLVAEWIGF